MTARDFSLVAVEVAGAFLLGFSVAMHPLTRPFAADQEMARGLAWLCLSVASLLAAFALGLELTIVRAI